MKPAIKAKWCKALKSGKFRQGEGALSYRGTYCCLGVLRTLMPKNLQKDSKVDENGTLNTKQLTWAGLHHSTQDNLAEMNDCGIKFKEIANYIEKRL